jgi:hypothetical protein
MLQGVHNLSKFQHYQQMANTEVNTETLDKHFTDAPNLSIPPVKQPQTEAIGHERIKELTEAYWAGKSASLSNAYQMGKMLAKSKEMKKTTDIFELLSDTIIQGIKSANLKADISSEKLQESFTILTTIFKVIGSDLNAIYAPGTSNITSPTQSIQPEAQREPVATKQFNTIEFLATLNGFITTKIYG